MLTDVVKKSYSVSEVMRRLGMLFSGGTHGHITKKIKMYEIDTSHFKQQHMNIGKSPINKKLWQEILIKKENSNTERTKLLRRALMESGREYKCEDCGLKDNWNGKPICIQIDHINGNRSDNRLENLRFLCPNCHSQTSTFNVAKTPFRKEKIKKCIRCGIDFTYNTTRRKYCSVKCANQKECKERKTKIVWPEKNVLLQMLLESNFTQVAFKLGISDNAIRKHLRKLENITVGS